MPLKRILGQLVDHVPGSRGAILIDWEGEAVDQVARMDDYELKVIGAHNGVILCNLREIISRLGGDQLEEIVISTAITQTVVLPVTHEYYLVFTFDREAQLGLALFASRRCALQLRDEIL